MGIIAMEEQKNSKQTEARRAASRKYLAKFAEMKIRITEEYRQEIQDHAARTGESATAFIKRAIAETMERDQAKLK